MSNRKVSCWLIMSCTPEIKIGCDDDVDVKRDCCCLVSLVVVVVVALLEPSMVVSDLSVVILDVVEKFRMEFSSGDGDSTVRVVRLTFVDGRQ